MSSTISFLRSWLIPLDFSTTTTWGAPSLPPQHANDCSIELLPSTTPPRERLYSLSAPERLAMDKYIGESLVAGLIQPSSSPSGAGFFFVEKKDRSLRPCIDYRGLNKITVKNRYILPLISSAISELIKFFTKLDLCNAYHLVRIWEKGCVEDGLQYPQWPLRVLSFCLTNAPAVFQALINDILGDVINHHIFVYLDVILLFYEILEQYVKQVR